MGDPELFLLPACVSYYYPETAVLRKQILTCSKYLRQRIEILFYCLLPADFMIVSSVMAVAIIWRRRYDCAKFYASKTLNYLVSVTLDHPKGFAVQIQNKRQYGGS